MEDQSNLHNIIFTLSAFKNIVWNVYKTLNKEKEPPSYFPLCLQIFITLLNIYIASAVIWSLSEGDKIEPKSIYFIYLSFFAMI